MKMLLTCFMAIVLISSLGFGQTIMITNFDDPISAFTTSKEAASKFTLLKDEADKHEGTASIQTYSVLGNMHTWGTYCEFIKSYVTPENWAASESISVWIKVTQPAAIATNLDFRITISDRPTATDNAEGWVFQDSFILDSISVGTNGWTNIKVPLVSTGYNVFPDKNGFKFPPADWNQPFNNKKFDLDKIISWRFSMVSANSAPESVRVAFDQFERLGNAAVPVVFFNGKTFTAPISNGPSAWGQSTINVVPNPDIPNSNMIEWVQGNEWGTGWSGWNEDLTPTNMAGVWKKDSIKFRMKNDAGVGPVRVQLAAVGGGLVGTVFTPNGDGQWHDYAFPIKNMVYQDGKTSIDSTQINKLEFMAEASAIVGKKLYFSEIKIGNPVFDVIAPVKPANPASTVEDVSLYKNTLAWDKYTAEAGVRYNAYVSGAPWTVTSSSAVIGIPPVDITMADAAAIGTTSHYARTPLTDKQVTLHYGLTVKDGAGNESAPAFASPLTMTARGVPTIALKTVAFTPDGELNEWQDITPFDVAISKGTGRSDDMAGKIDDDADLSTKAYIAVDNNYLYIAWDVTDDVFSVDTNWADTYLLDAPDLFIGLYDWDGKLYTGLKTSGNTPDLHFRFCSNKVLADNGSVNKNMYYAGGANYYFGQKPLDPGYVVEAKIALADIRTSWPDISADFVPVNGMRIPIDLVINDNDTVSTHTRVAALNYSEYNIDDYGYRYRWSWSYTWLGDGVAAVGDDNAPIAYSYALNQNYPNPFNPATNITFRLANAGYTNVTVYDLLGRQISTLASGYQSAGQHTVTFNAQNLPSGMYLYRIESGDFKAVKKMILLK